MKIDKAVADDLDIVSTLLAAQLGEHEMTLESGRLRAGITGMLADPSRGTILLARDGEAAIGIAVLATTWTLEHGGSVAWLDELYVVPDRREGGVGRALLERALAEAIARGARAVELEVDAEHARAERLYERRGFRRLPRARWALTLANESPQDSDRSYDRSPLDVVDHVSLGVNDLGASRRFYDAALGPLGFRSHQEIPGEVGYFLDDDTRHRKSFGLFIGFEDPNLRRPVQPSAGFHIAFRAPSRAVVIAFYDAALKAGGRDNGAPGLRPAYHSHYFGAFVLDPDGHHLEVVCHSPATTASLISSGSPTT